MEVPTEVVPVSVVPMEVALAEEMVLVGADEAVAVDRGTSERCADELCVGEGGAVRKVPVREVSTLARSPSTVIEFWDTVTPESNRAAVSAVVGVCGRRVCFVTHSSAWAGAHAT